MMNDHRVIRAAIMARLMQEADDDLTEASDYCRELRDSSSPRERANHRYAAAKLDEARIALQAARDRLGV